MEKIIGMLEQLESDLRSNKQYSAADKVLPIIREAHNELENERTLATHTPEEVFAACVHCRRLP